MAAATGRGFGMSARRLKRLERAVEGFLAQLQCAICLCVYDTPVSLPCNHCFCEECIHRALELKPVCPICIMPAKKRQLRRDAMIQQLLVATEKLQSAESLVESDEAPAQAVATGNGAAQTATPEPPPVAARASGPADPVAAAAEEQPSESHATEESTKSPTSTEASIPIANESDQPASADPERPAQTPPDQLVPLMASAEDKQENVAIEDAGSVSEPNVEAPSMPADKSPASSTDEDIEMIEPPKPAVEGTAREPLVLYDTLVEESQLSEEPPLQTEEPEVKAVAVVNEEPAPVAIEPQAETTKSEAGESTATAVAASGASPVKQTDAKPVIVAASRPPMTPSVVSNESRASVSSTVSDSVAASRPRRKSRLAQNQPEPESQLTEPLPLNGPFAVGDLVDVIERTWVGVNKPGGAARILKVNDDGTYDVRYIINSGKERGIHDFFIRRPKEDLMADTTPGRSVKQRARRSRTSMSSPGTPLTGRSAHGSVNGRTNGKRKRSGMVFLCSGFTDSTMQNLAKWAKPLGASIVSKWTADVTHLIVKCVSGKDGDGDASRDSNSLSAQSASPSNGGQRPTIPGKRKLFTDPDAEPVKRWVKLRSLKYLKALVGGRWIVSEEWLHGECSIYLLPANNPLLMNCVL